jgi:hypothetical protein
MHVSTASKHTGIMAAVFSTYWLVRELLLFGKLEAYARNSTVTQRKGAVCHCMSLPRNSSKDRTVATSMCV